MSKKSSIFIWIIALILVMGGSYAFLESQKDTETDKLQESIKDDYKTETNQTENLVRVPDIRLSSTLGESVSIRDYDDKVLVIYYWASWCPPCIFGMPEIQEIHEQFEQRDDLKLIAVNATDGVRETKEVATKFLNDNNYTFLSLFDENSRIGNFFGINFIPTVFVIDRQGVVYKQIDKDDIIRTVNEVI